LVACEESATVREAFRKRGHDAWSCDLIESRIPGNHIIGDALEAAYGQYWDLMLAFPPCTYLCRSSEQWLKKQPDRWQKMVDGANFFKRLFEAPIEKVCIENPQPHQHALKLIGYNYTQAINPNKFGDPATKRTCLWLKNLLPLVWQDETDLLGEQTTVEPEWVYSKRTGRKWGKWFWESSLIPVANGARARFRSTTFPGIANAMASQWGGHLTPRAADALFAPSNGFVFQPELIPVSVAGSPALR